MFSIGKHVHCWVAPDSTTDRDRILIGKNTDSAPVPTETPRFQQYSTEVVNILPAVLRNWGFTDVEYVYNVYLNPVFRDEHNSRPHTIGLWPDPDIGASREKVSRKEKVRSCVATTNTEQGVGPIFSFTFRQKIASRYGYGLYCLY